MAASSSGHVDVVSALIEAHADVHTQDNVCSTNHSASLPVPHYMGVAGFWREGRGGRLVAQSIQLSGNTCSCYCDMFKV